MYTKYKNEAGSDALIVELTKEGASKPRYANNKDNGLDLFSPESVTIAPGKRVTIDTGVKCKFPPFVWGHIVPKSGLAHKYGIDTLAGIVDESYRGNLNVILVNHGEDPFEIKAGDKIAQLVLMPSVRASVVNGTVTPDTDRGEGKFGSTGK